MEEDYLKYIESLAANREPIMFYNSSPEHAAIVMSTIFKYAKERLRIYAGNFCGKVSGDERYQRELKKFLDRKGQLEIILEEYNEANNPQLFNILRYYQSEFPERVTIKVTESKIIDSETSQKIHFTIGDTSMFRLETDTANFTATGSFNNSEIASKLIGLFDGISKAKGNPLTLAY